MIVIGIDQKVCTSQFRNQYCGWKMSPALSTKTISGTNRSGILWIFVSPWNTLHRIRRSFFFLFRIWVWILEYFINCDEIIATIDFQSKEDPIEEPDLSPNFVSRPVPWVCWTSHSFWGTLCSDFFHSFIWSIFEVPTFWWRSKFPITSFPITFHARYLNHVLAKLAEKMNHSCKIWNPLKRLLWL